MAEIRDIWLYAHNMIRSARQIINRSLRPLGLSSAEGNVLLHLWTQGQEMGQEQLVEQLDVSKPAVSRTLHLLERKGYVLRQRDPDDKRAHRIRLTDRALEIARRTAPSARGIVSVLEGGYDPGALGECVDAHLRALVEATTGSAPGRWADEH